MNADSPAAQEPHDGLLQEERRPTVEGSADGACSRIR